MLPARLPHHRIARTYAWIAPTHDWLARIVEARARERLLSWADVNDGDRILEVAVGTGLSFEKLLRLNPHGHLEAIDLTPAMMRKAARRAHRSGHPSYRMRIGDARHLPDFEAPFDVVLCSYMFDLLPADAFVPVLGGFLDVLRPGGRLVMANMTRGRVWYEHLWELLYRVHPALLGGCRGVEVAPALGEAGFVNIRRAFVRQWLFPSEVLYAERPAED